MDKQKDKNYIPLGINAGSITNCDCQNLLHKKSMETSQEHSAEHLELCLPGSSLIQTTVY